MNEQNDIEQAARLITEECNAIRDMLLAKNAAYGNSVLRPIRIMSKADTMEQINVRIDDKLSRLMRGGADDGEDTEKDLIGYLIIKRVKRREMENECVESVENIAPGGIGTEVWIDEPGNEIHGKRVTIHNPLIIRDRITVNTGENLKAVLYSSVRYSAPTPSSGFAVGRRVRSLSHISKGKIGEITFPRQPFDSSPCWEVKFGETDHSIIEQSYLELLPEEPAAPQFAPGKRVVVEWPNEIVQHEKKGTIKRRWDGEEARWLVRLDLGIDSWIEEKHLRLLPENEQPQAGRVQP